MAVGNFKALALLSAVLLWGCQPQEDGTQSNEGSSSSARTSQEDTGPRLMARPSNAPRAEAETPRDFVFERYQVNLTNADPEVCLIFSHALDPNADYSAYVATNTKDSLAFSVNGQHLCLGGFGFGAEPTLALREGLPSSDHGALAREETVSLFFGTRPAYVGISGDGVILPRRDADGLAFETVNVDTLSITVSRVNDRALVFRSVSQGLTAGEREWGWLYGEENPNDVKEVLWQGEMDITGAPNTPVTSVFPLAETLGTLQPGAYFIEAQNKEASPDEYEQPARTMRWLIITDLAFSAYRGEEGLDLSVRSLQTAQPVRNVRVQLVASNNEILGEGRTDGEGRARFAAPLMRGTGPMRPRLVMGYGADNDFAILDLERNPVDLSEQGIGGRQRPDGADGFIWLDRGIYRPGESVHVGTLLRNAAAQAISDRAGSLILYAPNGLEMARKRFERAEAAGAVFWDVALSRTAARGEWRIVAELDGLGVVASTALSVEDFVPQRISLDLAVDESPLQAREERAIESDVQFLYGAPGAGLSVEGRVRFEPDPNPFPDYRGYQFGRHDDDVQEVSRSLDPATTDGAGKAVLALTTQGELTASSHPLRARVVISALEPGGRAVSDDVRIPYRPRDSYLGLKPGFEGRAPRNQAARFDVVNITRLGEGQGARVNWQLVRLDWDYDWYRDGDSQWRWRRSLNRVPIETGIVNLAENGEGAITLPELDWGDYELVARLSDGGAVASQTFWVGWGARANGGVEAPDRVRVSVPDAPTPVGQSVTLGLQSPYAGLAEVVIATDRVLETRSVVVPEGGTEVSFEVDERWGAGAYAMVSVFTPRDPVAQPRPRRAVGVSYVPVDTAPRNLDLALEVDEIVRPRQSVSVSVEAQNAPYGEAWIVLAAVDEGILALTRFQSPDPVAWYLGQTALDVALYDDYGRLLDPNQGAAAPVRTGGDQIGGAGLSVVPTKTVALYSGPVRFNAQGEAQIALDIPDFNGQLRLMAVAWSRTQVGAASQALTVRDAVPSEAILPRFLAPGDVAQATISLDNVEGPAGAYQVQFNAEGAARADQSANVSLEPGERQDTRLEIIGQEIGISDVTLEVTGPEGYSVAHSYPIEVRSAYLPITEVTRTRLAPGESWQGDRALLTSFEAGSSDLTLTVSSSMLDGQALMASLSRYPYGCSEQTLSKAIPLLYAWQLGAYEDDPRRSGEVRTQIQTAISTLLARQDAQGVFGLWRVGDGAASPWVGVYATDFLARAQAAGFSVPEDAMERAYTALALIAREQSGRLYGYHWDVYRWRGSNDSSDKLRERSAAYALYVLAREGRADRSRLRYLHDERLRRIQSPLALAHIGAGLALMGDQSRAHSAFALAESRIGYSNTGDWYQTVRRDLAGVTALAAEAHQSELLGRLSERVGQDLPESARLTTQEKAYLVMAYWAMNGGQAVPSYSLSGIEGVRPGEPVVLSAEVDPSAITLTNTGDLPIWVSALGQGTPIDTPAAAEQGLALSKTLFSPQGEALSGGELRQGERVIIRLELTSPEDRLVPAIIEDLLPAGFEIEAILTPADGGPNGVYAWLGALDQAQTVEKRDDRFVAAMELRNKQTIRMAYVVRAVTPGRFTLPAAYAEDMYRPDVFARTEVSEIAIAP
ncbi:alpha-2-macroglobulin family protein [Woodsholea maritima]|uniref:alpha-2-macroglobulin family protein n=1 Tax=Woodsholea maritima TaxID=240237 RepID=UPI00036A60FF|nr:alpha-2-macroglobulin [Woodsholea maritima]